MKLYTEIHNNRTVILGWDDPNLSRNDVYKSAFDQGLMTEGRHRFVSYGRGFAYLKSGNIHVCAMRENWNGWHDVAIYDAITMAEIGTKTYANPSAGQHRDVVSLT